MQNNYQYLEFDNFRLRLVRIEDSDFIINLRTKPMLSRYVSFIENNVDKQEQWIKQYKIREKEGLEYYYIAEDINKNKWGTIRLYNLNAPSFEHGSWIFLPKSPNMMSIRTEIYIRLFAFNSLGFLNNKFEVRKDNRKVLRYHKLFDIVQIGEDDLYFYFNIKKDSFLNSLEFVYKTFGII